MDNELRILGWKKFNGTISLEGWQCQSLWFSGSQLLIVEDDSNLSIISADIMGPFVGRNTLYYARVCPKTHRLRGIYKWNPRDYIQTICL